MKRKILSTFVLAGAFLLPLSVNAKDITSDLTLTEDVKDGIVVKSGSNVTLDLGGFNITNKANYDTITIEEGATLTIKGNGKVDNTSHGKAPIANNGTLTVNSGTFYRKDSVNGNNKNTFYVILNRGKMTINGGTFEIENGYSSLIDNGWYKPEQNTSKTMSELTINNGTFNMSGNDKYIKNDDYGIMTVNNGTFTMKDPASAVISNIGFYTGKELLTVNGGTFNYTGTNYAIWDYDWNKYGYTDNSTTVVNGGNFNLSNTTAKVTNIELGSDTPTDKDSSKKFEVIGKDNAFVIAKESDLKDILDVNTIDESSLSSEEIALIKEATADKYNVAGYFNIDLYKGLSDDVQVEQLTETTSKVKVTINLPSSLDPVKDGYTRTYHVVRVHDGKTDILDATLNEDGTLSFETDKFSTYTVVYDDVKVQNKVPEKNPNTFDGILGYALLSIVSLGIVSSTGLYLKKRMN